MKFACISARVLEPVRAAVVGLLCVLMAVPPVFAAPPAMRKVQVKHGQIQGQERVLHVLNRFTFGPRPGDVAAVERMGVRQWFEQQLNPDSIDDSSLNARLALYPAMNMPQQELMQRYPTPEMLRQIIRRDLPLPENPTEHTIYADQIAFMKLRQEKQAEKKQAAANTAADPAAANMAADPAAGNMVNMKSALPGDKADPSTPSMQAHEDELYAGLDAVRIVNLPPDQRFQRIMAMTPEDLISFRQNLNRNELNAADQGLGPQQKEILESLEGSERMVNEEVLSTRMLRDIYSERQLQAVMTDFWLNHFNVYLHKNQNEPYLLPAYERDTIRPHALGKFEDLLVAVAQSPAMMIYLDNWQSIGPHSLAAENAGKAAARAKNPQVKQALKDRGLNENYGRELMELHTLGVQCEVSKDRPVKDLDKACGKGYTQQDVIEVAKVLTGWGVDRPFMGAEFRFNDRQHEPGTKTVMGVKIKENGQGEGFELLHMLANSPATAKFISTKLAIRFVSDTPPPALINRMTEAYMKSGGDISDVLRAMFNAPEFWSPEVYRAKVKTPEEFVISAVRASGADVTNPLPLAQTLNRLGMPFYGMQTPNGYDWKADPWVNTGDLVDRMNFALVLTSDRLPGVTTNWTHLLGEANAGVEPAALAEDNPDALIAAKEKKLEAMLLGQPASDKTRATVLAQYENEDAQRQAVQAFAIRPGRPDVMAGVLNAGAPRPQVRPPLDRQAAGMAGLLIGSPEFQRR
ncbi:hypothetical protein GCM10011507_06620 [Edaphobacter acidisoli]|uniref:DUF1800 domain-containing protein n=1 Tax=Edaphobacter acidisoli TaxID=2040573 RepID=A0A916RIL7_9BACT|nr:DUF1800 domain-containing protein [Edaphobacter acidisoli]GGA57954.1 hypothetical protein GCM10011507_06620 [Edaphobacter acidisoli]